MNPSFGLQFVDRQMRQLPRAVPVEALRLPEDRAGAARNRVGDVRAAVAMRAGIRGESIARPEPAAVGTDPRDRRAQPAEQLGGVEIGDGRGVHVSSRTATASAGTTTVFVGASGATPSSRSAPPMTSAKTGAATVPP